MDAQIFNPTAVMVARHGEWAKSVEEITWAGWVDSGQVAMSCEVAALAIAHVRTELMVTDRPKWMHPLDAFAINVSAPDGPIPHDATRIDRLDAMRTTVGIGEYLQLRWVAEILGITVGQAKFYAPSHNVNRKVVDGGVTSVYRHFDDAGTLLYVGIAKDPDTRFVLHRYTSKWAPFSSRCELEWHETRQEALRAEREAIAHERPLFNVIGSLVDPQEAIDYLATKEAAELDRIAEMLVL